MTGDLRQADRSPAGPVAMHYDTVDDVKLVWCRLEQRGRDVQRFGPDFKRRRMRRAARHDRGAGSVGADAILDAVGLSRHDPHLAVVHADRAGADLRHRRGEALADRRAAGHQLDRAGAVDGDARAVEWSKPAFLDKDGDARPDQFTRSATAAQLRLQRIPADLRQRFIQQSRIVAGIVDDFGAERVQLPAKRHLGSGDEVAPAHPHPVEAKPVGDRVDEPLAHEGALEPSRRSIGCRGRLVGQAEVADAAIGRDAVRPGHHGHGHLCNPGAMGAHIGALVEVEYVFQGQDLAVGVDRCASVVGLLARVVGGHQMLVPVLDPFDRPPQSHCGDADEKIFGVELAAYSKPTPGIAFLQHHRRRAAAEHARQCVAVAVRHLGRAVQFQHIS